MKIEKILNGDGTEFSPPRNPLREKWERLYPGCEATGYKCMYCGECPCGDYWKVPEEDLNLYDLYVQSVRQYNLEHENTSNAHEILERIMNERLKNLHLKY